MQQKIGRILVTGAGGFIGSHLVEHLALAGESVTAFLHYNSRADLGLLKYLPRDLLSNVEVHFGDLKDPHSVAHAMKEKDCIFHLGALIGIPYSYSNPSDVVQTNVIGTLNVLMAARDLGIKRLIHTSTSEVYGTAKSAKISEEHPLQSQSPYSASKIGADKLVESFVAAYQLPAVTIRPFNTFGPRQSMRAVIPTIISQVCFQDEVVLGSLSPVRDFTFVGDTVDAFLLAAQAKGIEGKLFNLGTDREASIGEIVEMVLKMTKKTGMSVRQSQERVRPETSEVFRLRSDNTKAQEILKWHPKTSLEEGIAKTIDFILDHPQDYSRSGYFV